MIEIHGAIWRDDQRWWLVFERHDAATDLLAIVTSNDALALLRAELCHRFENGEYDKPVWECFAEALFGAGDLVEAIQYAERLIQERSK